MKNIDELMNLSETDLKKLTNEDLEDALVLIMKEIQNLEDKKKQISEK